MNTRLLSTTAAALVLLSAQAFAADPVISAAEGGARLNDSFPALNAKQGQPLSREVVKAELTSAVNSGTVQLEGDGGAWVSEHQVARGPAGKSRDAVKAELADAIRVGGLRGANTPY